MKKAKRQPRQSNKNAEEVRAPYWAHAHRDWRFLVVVFLMLAALATYVVTGDLRGLFHGQPATVVTPGGK